MSDDIAAALLAYAERNELVHLLARMVAIVERNGGHMWPEDQADYRHARAVLAAHGGGK